MSDPRVEVWPTGSPRGQWVAPVLAALFFGTVCWLAIGAWTGIGCVVAAAVWGLVAQRRAELWVLAEGRVDVFRRERRIASVPLANIREVEVPWGPYNSRWLFIRSAQQTLELPITTDTEELRHVLGRGLRERPVRPHYSSAAESALGWTDRR